MCKHDSKHNYITYEKAKPQTSSYASVGYLRFADLHFKLTHSHWLICVAFFSAFFPMEFLATERPLAVYCFVSWSYNYKQFEKSKILIFLPRAAASSVLIFFPSSDLTEKNWNNGIIKRRISTASVCVRFQEFHSHKVTSSSYRHFFKQFHKVLTFKSFSTKITSTHRQ